MSFWNQVADFSKQLFMQAQETQKNKGDIKELQQEVKELSATVQRLIYEVHRMGENEQHEREKMALRFELELLRSGRQLPPGRPDEEKN
jgi:predicted RNase H-like nuclease (RuvC/YqgF family)